MRFSPLFDAFFTPIHRKNLVILQPEKILSNENKLVYILTTDVTD